MTSERRQSTSSHSFIVWYNGKTPKDNITVNLTINYSNKTYSINSCNGNNFTFHNNNGGPAKWLAVAEAIKAAVDYADQELFGTKEVQGTK